MAGVQQRPVERSNDVFWPSICLSGVGTYLFDQGLLIHGRWRHAKLIERAGIAAKIGFKVHLHTAKTIPPGSWRLESSAATARPITSASTIAAALIATRGFD
jgi:hypothetical protein